MPKKVKMEKTGEFRPHIIIDEYQGRERRRFFPYLSAIEDPCKTIFVTPFRRLGVGRIIAAIPLKRFSLDMFNEDGLSLTEEYVAFSHMNQKIPDGVKLEQVADAYWLYPLSLIRLDERNN